MKDIQRERTWRHSIMNKLRVAVVGCGFVAQKRHIPSFLRLKKKASICAVCDLNRDLARNVAAKFGIRAAYASLSEMLSNEKLDIVDICTPPQTHASVAVQTMEAGCNVLMEKPMALAVSDCDKMIRASHQHGVKLSVVHNQKFYPPFLEAQRLVETGAIGQLTGMRIMLLTPRAEYLAHENHWIHRLPGGIIGETGPHAVYLALTFVRNVENVNVYASKKTDYPWVLYDDYRIELQGKDVTASIYISHANDYTAQEVDLLGTDCELKVDLQSMLLMRYRRRDLKQSTIAFSSLNMANQMIRGIFSNAFGVMLHKTMLGHDIMIEKFVESVINGQPVPVTPEEGREVTRVLEEIVQRLQLSSPK
jgi:predicted dehydrogenase